MESFSSTNYSKLDDDCAWSSQEWKAEATTYDRAGDLIKLLGEWYEKFDLIAKKFFSTEPPQSVRYGETLRDRSGRLDNINSQEVARPQFSSWETMKQNWNCL